MNDAPLPDRIEVRGLRLWAHVGVLEQERRLGQWFELDFRIAADLAVAGRCDDLAASHDYGLAITALQRQARSLCCHTLEHYSEQVLDLLEQLYGPMPLQVRLCKCRAPVPGFTGSVAVLRSRRWPPGHAI
ncbi:MAG: dihydroneopterin aldolase [Synechococcaceae cyanobacterium]|nr:dihydroneopterin aldolase [Synechococcaceae cyanobacterium]